MTNGAACTICRAGTVLLASVSPPANNRSSGLIPASFSAPPSSRTLVRSSSRKLSCGGLQSVASERWRAKDEECDAWRIEFSDACCGDESERSDGIDDRDAFSFSAEASTRGAQEVEAIGEAEVTAEGAAVLSTAIPLYACEQHVRSHLFGDSSNYSATAVPVPSSSSILNVSTSISFYHATELSTVKSTAELFFGFVLSWNDERLAWNPSDLGGCDAFSARASLDAEKTDIWVPELDLINRDSGVQALPDAMADISSAGDVEWYRLGGVKAICFFEGLERFPYDELGCEFQFGSYSKFSRVSYIFNEDVLFPEGRRIAKYQEYTVLPEKTTVSTENEGYTRIRIRFVFARSSRYYTITLIVPTFIFTFVSFGMFLLDIRVGERLAFGVSLLLVIVANAILTADLLPICSERIWVNVFTTTSYYWILAGLLESIAVAYLYFLETEEREANERKEAAEAEGKRAGSEAGKGSHGRGKGGSNGDTCDRNRHNIKEKDATETPSPPKEDECLFVHDEEAAEDVGVAETNLGRRSDGNLLPLAGRTTKKAEYSLHRKVEEAPPLPHRPEEAEEKKEMEEQEEPSWINEEEEKALTPPPSEDAGRCATNRDEENAPANANNGSGSHTGRNRPVLTRQVNFRACTTLRHKLIASPPHPSRTWRMRAIRRMDRACVVVFPVTYVVFFATMLTRNKYW